MLTRKITLNTHIFVNDSVTLTNLFFGRGETFRTNTLSSNFFEQIHAFTLFTFLNRIDAAFTGISRFTELKLIRTLTPIVNNLKVVFASALINDKAGISTTAANRIIIDKHRWTWAGIK